MDKFREGIQKLSQLLGKKNVTFKSGGLDLRFNLNMGGRIDLLNNFAAHANKNHLVFSANRMDEDTLATLPTPSDENAVVITIPLNPEQRQKLAEIAYFVHEKATRTSVVDESGARHTAVTEHDPAYRLTELTDIRWKRVNKSPYGTDVIQAMDILPVPVNTRNAREGILARKLFGEKGKFQMGDWLGVQVQAESQGKTPPLTAIPREWVDSHVDRLRNWEGDNAVTNVFRKR